MDIFSHLAFAHSRKNGFWVDTNEVRKPFYFRRVNKRVLFLENVGNIGKKDKSS